MLPSVSSPSIPPDLRARPFPIDEVLRRIRQAVRGFPPAMLFELYEEGHRTPYEVLLACLISIRTLDEVSLAVSRRLLARASDPARVARLSLDQLTDFLRGSSFPRQKAAQILALSRKILAESGGELPAEERVLLSLPGVGPKCANLVLGIAGGQARIGVDIHVHRVTNRWGYIHAATPEKSLHELERKLPRKHWVNINRWLVPFGKHICTGARPFCSTCPVNGPCQRIGVGAHR